MPPPDLRLAPRGSETVLLVDPEPETRKLAAFMLQRQGYTVLEARNSAEALGLSEKHEAPIDLLLTELTYLKPSGQELAHDLASRCPGMRVLYMSYPTSIRTPRYAPVPEQVFLSKPFTMRDLAGKVRKVLDAPRAKALAMQVDGA